MRILLYSSLAVCFSALCVSAQTISQLPPVSPFRIEQGVSFSASTARKPIFPEAREKSPAVNRISGDFTDALDLIKKNHIGGRSVDADALTKSSINSMLGELDPHSSYYDPTEFGVLIGDQESEYSGTGSSISNFVKAGKIETYIVSVHPGSAAARAGLRYGDRIVSVDGAPVSGATVDVVRDKVRGPRGTSVRVVVERAATGETSSIDLKRERVVQQTIPNHFMVRPTIGYVDLSEGFSLTTSTELEKALNGLGRSGMRSLVLDLRGNTGGVLDQAIKVAEKFLPAGSTIISQRGRDVQDNVTWTSENASPLNIPVVVLVNNRTASASEVVAGAFQDNDRALILGQTTYGKSLVQKVLELPSGSGLTLTTARYYTPSGRSIQRNYVSGDLYDYYQHRQSPADHIERRTVTNRPVFGGAGITPDVVTTKDAFNPDRALLTDVIFFFVRETIREKKLDRSGTAQLANAASDEIENIYMPRFRKFAASGSWDLRPKTLDVEAKYIAEQLRYNLALAAAGPQEAVRVRTELDPDVAKAIDALPRAQALAESARRAQRPTAMKKPARVAHSRAGQGRNRRN